MEADFGALMDCELQGGAVDVIVCNPPYLEDSERGRVAYTPPHASSSREASVLEGHAGAQRVERDHQDAVMVEKVEVVVEEVENGGAGDDAKHEGFQGKRQSIPEPQAVYGAVTEPEIALFASDKGTAAYRAIASALQASRHTLLHSATELLLEVGSGMAEMVQEIFTPLGWRCRHAALDAQGSKRCLLFTFG